MTSSGSERAQYEDAVFKTRLLTTLYHPELETRKNRRASGRCKAAQLVARYSKPVTAAGYRLTVDAVPPTRTTNGPMRMANAYAMVVAWRELEFVFPEVRPPRAVRLPRLRLRVKRIARLARGRRTGMRWNPKRRRASSVPSDSLAFGYGLNESLV